MEFVWMSYPGVEHSAKVPASAVPHWEGNGWERCEPPAKPTQIAPADVPPDPAVENLLDAPPIPVDEIPSKPSATKSKPKAAPTGRNEED